MTINFRPLHDLILVEKENGESITSSGIIIPDTAKEKQMTGTITAIGPGKYDSKGKFIPTTCRVGDKIFFGKWAGSDIKINDVEYLIIKESEIMGIIR